MAANSNKVTRSVSEGERSADLIRRRAFVVSAFALTDTQRLSEKLINSRGSLREPTF